MDEHDNGNALQQAEQAAALASARAGLEAQLLAAEQQSQELQSQLHHQEVRVANAEADSADLLSLSAMHWLRNMRGWKSSLQGSNR